MAGIAEKYKSFLTENYSIESIVLGSGEFSSVHLARNRTTKEPAAAKVVDLENYPHQFLSELRAMSACKHENIASFYGFRMGRSSPSGYLFMEYLPYPTLESFVTNSKTGFSERRTFQVIDQLLSAVNALHSVGISHHDLKPDNVLLNKKTQQIKIIDFGLSIAFDVNEPVVRHPSGTPLFLPPEVLEDQPHDPRAADIWSIGVTLFFMLKRTYPWGDDLSEEELLSAIKGVPVDLRSFSSKARILLKGMLSLNAKTRMTGPEARAILKEALTGGGAGGVGGGVGGGKGVEGVAVGLVEKSSNATVSNVHSSPQKSMKKDTIVTESPQKKTRKDSASSGHTRDSSRG